MDITNRVAQESSAVRAKVGAVIAKDGNILAYGYNGTAPGWDNTCEYLVPDFDESGNELPPVLVTRSEVIHAEIACISKCARAGIPIEGATLYLTLSPCIKCATTIIMCGIKEVFFKELYRDDAGVIALNNYGIPCIQHK